MEFKCVSRGRIRGRSSNVVRPLSMMSVARETESAMQRGGVFAMSATGRLSNRTNISAIFTKKLIIDQ